MTSLLILRSNAAKGLTDSAKTVAVQRSVEKEKEVSVSVVADTVRTSQYSVVH